ncbi:MAG TPA: hypothetical protein VKM72_28305 [Thermoanaerobaculia bacterium]|nr:hypothetical protein [Thermoanaerobaculia bacterium]
MEELIKSHSFELTLTKTGNSDDKLFEINLNDSLSEKGFESLCLGLTRNSTLPENRWRDSHLLEKVDKEG